VLKQTLAVKDCCPPSPRLADAGETEIAGVHEALIVIAAEAVWLASAALVATSVTGFEGGNAAGAVYVAVPVPVLETVPQFVPLHPAPVILHVTVWLALKQTFAVKFCCPPSPRLADAGEMEIAGVHD